MIFHRRLSSRFVLAFLLLGLIAVAVTIATAALAAPSPQAVTPTPLPPGAGPTQPSTPAQSASPTPSANPTQPPEQLSISNSVCLGCHGQPGLTMPLGDGSTLDLYVPADDYQHSIHGQQRYACVQCHRTVGNYPHPAFSAQDARDVTLKLNNACKGCHATQYNLTQDSVHAAALSKGNRNAAVCADCHTAHTVRQLIDPKTQKLLPDARVWIPQTCEKCHSAIYNEYKTSVHGSALIGEGNPDVPTCIDCHGVHNIQNPTTTSFRIESPSLCAKCHTDPRRMNKYGISTNVLTTYVADFHGTTDVLFGPQSPDSTFNEPVCYDCHGVHAILRPNDPINGLVVSENLLKRCQQCHPDATTNFPRAWLSHYVPSTTNNRLVFFVNLFYQLFIPTVIGGMALLVVMDFSRRNLNRYRARNRRRTTQPVAAASQADAPVPVVPPAGAEPAPPEARAAPPAPAAEPQANEPLAAAQPPAGEADEGAGEPPVPPSGEPERPQELQEPAPEAPGSAWTGEDQVFESPDSEVQASPPDVESVHDDTDTLE